MILCFRVNVSLQDLQRTGGRSNEMQYQLQYAAPYASMGHAPGQFYLHDQSAAGTPPRRTWEEVGTLQTPPSQGRGFLLHDRSEQEPVRYQNGGGGVYSEPSTPHRASPQHRHSVHRQISQLMDATGDAGKTSFAAMANQQQQQSAVTHAPIPAPPVDDMEPQSISFIGSAEDINYVQGISKLNISSGTRTYRIPSPTRPHIARNSFQPSLDQQHHHHHAGQPPATAEKGFYISFDGEQPKKPKPPLRLKRGSPKKEKPTEVETVLVASDVERQRQAERLAGPPARPQPHTSQTPVPTIRSRSRSGSGSGSLSPTALVIGGEETNALDPQSVDEMERRKERIMLLSLQRRQRQEEAKERKEAETQARRERDKAKEEERARRKRDQELRRQHILEQHKLKKAIEEAEREGKTLDRTCMPVHRSAGGGGGGGGSTKMRARGGGNARPRPKTIHVDSGSVELAEGLLQPAAQGKKGSSTNLSGERLSSVCLPVCSVADVCFCLAQSTLTRRRPRCAGTTTAAPRTAWPISGRLLRQPLPRRGRAKVSCMSHVCVCVCKCECLRHSLYERACYCAEAADRPKYSTLQAFGGRKSSSLMNLYGKVTQVMLGGGACNSCSGGGGGWCTQDSRLHLTRAFCSYVSQQVLAVTRTAWRTGTATRTLDWVGLHRRGGHRHRACVTCLRLVDRAVYRRVWRPACRTAAGRSTTLPATARPPARCSSTRDRGCTSNRQPRATAASC